MIRNAKEFADRVAALPDWMQKTLMDDLNCTVENRLATFERIAKKGHA